MNACICDNGYWMITGSMPELQGDPLDFFKEDEEFDYVSEGENEEEGGKIDENTWRLILSIVGGLLILGSIPCICYICRMVRSRRKLKAVEEKSDKRAGSYVQNN